MADPAAAPTHTPHSCLSLARVLALVGGVLLTTAFFMPWFSSQGLLLSGQFLHLFLSSPGDLRRLLPGRSGSPAEAQLLRAPGVLFPARGAVAFSSGPVGVARPVLHQPTHLSPRS